MEDTVGMLPDFGPSFRVEGCDYALFHYALAAAPDYKDSTSEYDRRGAADKFGTPHEVLARG